MNQLVKKLYIFLPYRAFRTLHGQIHNIALKGVEDSYAKHTDAQESKGIKAHFRMDESGILLLEHVNILLISLLLAPLGCVPPEIMLSPCH